MSVTGGHRTDGGQATVELALALPIVCLFALGMVQAAAVVADQLSVIAAAREGARAAAIAADPATAASNAAHAATGLRPLHVQAAVGDSTVTVTVRYTNPTDVPLVGALIPDAQLGAEVTMAVEPP